MTPINTHAYNFNLGLSGAEAQNAAFDLERNAKSTDAYKDAYEQARNEQELMTACRDFETYFINALFKELRKTTSFGGVEKSFAENYYQETLDEEYSKRATNSGGIGLARFLYEQMSLQNGRPWGAAPIRTNLK